ncbi:MAG: MerC family mercury resistance protein [Candidatus Magasanikbacteria bacterium]|nr:MerC family mercury resistance protein [Candidatus Magasanikbacteria bacterium]
MNKHADKLQSTGLLAGLLALFCLPCLLAPLLISVGLSSILIFLGTWLAPVLLVFVGISLVGFTLSYKIHKNFLPLVMAVLAGGIFYYSNFVAYYRNIGYAGAALLIAAVVADYIIRHRHKADCEDCVVKSKK